MADVINPTRNLP